MSGRWPPSPKNNWMPFWTPPTKLSPEPDEYVMKFSVNAKPDERLQSNSTPNASTYANAEHRSDENSLCDTGCMAKRVPPQKRRDPNLAAFDVL